MTRRRPYAAAGTTKTATIATSIATSAALVVAACEQRTAAPPTPSPPTPGAAVPLPDPLTLDWKNLVYDLGALGIVRTTAGRAKLGFVQDDDGILRATQDPEIVAEGAGSLGLEPPSYVDLDRDGHDEAVIPYELITLADAPRRFGLFVFTLRGGTPIQLARLDTPARRAFTLVEHAIVIESVRWSWDERRDQLAPRR